MKSFILLTLILAAASMHAQCTPAASGTQCQGPLSVLPATGAAATTIITFTPATVGGACGTLDEMCVDSNGNLEVSGVVLGQKGDTGAQGPSGQAATIQVGTVTTLPAGSQATFTNVGSSSAAVFNVGIPVGATGAVGKTGPPGTMPASFTCTVTQARGTWTFKNCH